MMVKFFILYLLHLQIPQLLQSFPYNKKKKSVICKIHLVLQVLIICPVQNSHFSNKTLSYFWLNILHSFRIQFNKVNCTRQVLMHSLQLHNLIVLLHSSSAIQTLL